MTTVDKELILASVSLTIDYLMDKDIVDPKTIMDKSDGGILGVLALIDSCANHVYSELNTRQI